MNVKQAYVEGIKKEMELWESWISETSKDMENTDWLPEFPDGITVVFNGAIEAFMTPFNRSVMVRMLDLMAKQGWELCGYITEREAAPKGWIPVQYYRKDDRNISIHFEVQMEGSTCKRHEVGKHMVEQSVYEFSCEGLDDPG